MSFLERFGIPSSPSSEREQMADRVRAYMADQMGMSDPLDDQEQNWIYSHMTEFALLVNAGVTPVEEPQPESAPKSSSSSSVSLSERETLQQQIMNLPCVLPDGYPGGHNALAYKQGHRDARHAAAEIATSTFARLQSERETQDTTVRQMLWLNHGCPIAALYGDDGELQCGNGHPYHRILDFKREPLKDLVLAVVGAFSRRAKSERETLIARGEGQVTFSTWTTTEGSATAGPGMPPLTSGQGTLIAERDFYRRAYEALMDTRMTQPEAEVARLSSQLAGLRTAVKDVANAVESTVDHTAWFPALARLAALAASQERTIVQAPDEQDHVSPSTEGD